MATRFSLAKYYRSVRSLPSPPSRPFSRGCSWLAFCPGARVIRAIGETPLAGLLSQDKLTSLPNITMIVYPDLELRKGRLVNLLDGKMENPIVYDLDPVKCATKPRPWAFPVFE